MEKKKKTYAEDEWDCFIDCKFPPFECPAPKRGEFGAEESDWRCLISSTSDTEPFLFFLLLENALLKELLNYKGKINQLYKFLKQ